ncbi:ATP-NAD kinase family protein [Streptomyces sp. NPDC048172]|uniref:ATP-NAD kinase family protein n=1 Tax=Streptomyces sp. NPDC048172 TaxID=3365505 RepID=UPI0037238B4B
MTPFRIGLVVNPVAGLGGRVGLKGSDGVGVQERARALGAVPRAGARASAALTELRARGVEFELLTAGGPMGVDGGRAVHSPTGDVTSAADTVAAVRALRAAGAGLLLFAGGDGTARDVHDALAPDGAEVPVLGIPTGVKMHSAVFAVNPRAAGEVAAAYVRDAGGVRLRRAEVMDRDEAALREGRVTARLHGWLNVPHVPTRVQQRKTGSAVVDPEAVGGLAAELAERVAELSPALSGAPPGRDCPSPDDAVRGRVVAGRAVPRAPSALVLGPGTTTQGIAAALGADVSPTGVSVLAVEGRSASVVAPDATGDELLELARERAVLIALSPIGGQGFLLGRGNQQIGPELIRAVGAERLALVASEAKLAALGGRPLLLDSGDAALDAALSGYRPVLTGRGTCTMYRITT